MTIIAQYQPELFFRAQWEAGGVGRDHPLNLIMLDGTSRLVELVRFILDDTACAIGIVAIDMPNSQSVIYYRDIKLIQLLHPLTPEKRLMVRTLSYDELASSSMSTYGLRESVLKVLRTAAGVHWVSPLFTAHYVERERYSTLLREVSKGRLTRLQGPAFRIDSDSIMIPGKKLSFPSTVNGLELRVYMGDNWERDAEAFYSDINAKRHMRPRISLLYRGSDESTKQAYSVTQVYRSFLVAESDWGEEYTPQKGEPTYYLTSAIVQEFCAYLAKLSANIENNH